jgi:excisionase family DNA binding protein
MRFGSATRVKRGCQKPGHRERGSTQGRRNCVTMKTGIERLAYSIDEIVQSSGLSRSTVKRLIGEGKLQTVKIGRRILIPASSFHQLLRVGD